MSRLSVAGLTAAAIAAAALGVPGQTSIASTTPAAKPHTSPVTGSDAAPDKTFTPAKRAAALKQAKAHAGAVAKQLGLTASQRLHVTDVERDRDGSLHVRYSRTLGGLPVMGGDLVVHQAPDGHLRGADFATDQPLTLATDVTTEISAARASAVAGQVRGSASKVLSTRKVVWAVDGVPRLAWLVQVVRHRDGVHYPREVVIDARTGRRIQAWDLDEQVQGDGRTLYSGRVTIQSVKNGSKYQLKDTTRGGSVTVDVHNRVDPDGGFLPGDIFTDTDNVWGNGKAGDRETAAADAAYGVAQTWDYYLDTFDRRGIANNGTGAKSRVHYGKNFDNAFWNDDCFCMTFGDGGTSFKPVVSLDVAGHEMSHGVTSRTAGLYYFGDAGGLNESTSDIFGTMVEFYSHSSVNPGNYRIGEQIVKPAAGAYLRRMDHPSLDGVSYDCWSIGMGLDDPHFTSGPGNHFFYMLAEGSGKKTINGYENNSPTCNGAAAVQGVGRSKASQIWYRALTRYFVSTTNYIDARDATIHAAIDLYGKNSAECGQVLKAWNAVAVPAQYWTCAGGLDEGADTFGANGGFEQGDKVWGHTGQAAITRNANLGLPRTGQWYGLLNSTGGSSVGTLTHRITVPNTNTAMLRFYMLISAPDSVADYGTVDVKINGKAIPNGAGHFDGSYANNSFIRWDVPVNKWKGDTVTLSIRGEEDYNYFQVLLDDFTLTPR